jgi:hypothetical protein
VFLADQLTAGDLAVEQPAFYLAFLPSYLIAGGLWGRGLGRIAGYTQTGGFSIAGALGIALPTGGAIAVLTAIEHNLARFVREGMSVHIVFAIAFGLTALMLAGMGGFAIGVSLRNLQLTGQLALAGGGAGGLAFLVVNVVMDRLGFRVGAPLAEQRATMLVVAVLGLWATAIVGSVTIGHVLAQAAAKRATP